MTKTEADALMIARFEQLDKAAEQAQDNAELVAITETEIKTYITLCNARAFEGMSGQGSGSMLN